MDLSHIDPQTRYKITLLMMIAFSTFVCLFVRIKSKNQYSASCWEGSKLCGSDHTRAESHNTCNQRQRYKPRTCQSMVNTLQVYGLARISELTPAPTPTRPQPPKCVPPCLV